jgi:uncharacterized membrane protein
VNANQVIVLATVVGTLVAVVSLIIAIRNQAQKAAADEARPSRTRTTAVWSTARPRVTTRCGS